MFRFFFFAIFKIFRIFGFYLFFNKKGRRFSCALVFIGFVPLVPA
ncbi:hypothetical protein CF65_02147 [Aggregatibacter actinomycetemcomitans HK1651]|nr:hypothetical protein CF65_02147 [Aggregatibacter actinomycetemcomitans HK1651]